MEYVQPDVDNLLGTCATFSASLLSPFSTVNHGSKREFGNGGTAEEDPTANREREEVAGAVQRRRLDRRPPLQSVRSTGDQAHALSSARESTNHGDSRVGSSHSRYTPVAGKKRRAARSSTAPPAPSERKEEPRPAGEERHRRPAGHSWGRGGGVTAWGAQGRSRFWLVGDDGDSGLFAQARRRSAGRGDRTEEEATEPPEIWST